MSRHPLNGIVSYPFPDLAPVMKQWQRLMKSLGKAWADKKYGSQRDVPWWYRERTAVGFLAGAIWKSGGAALEEYSTDKKNRTKRRGKKKSPGRGDLMFSLGKRKWYVAEAKIMEAALDRPIWRRACEPLQLARKDAVRTPTYGWAKRVGLLFLVPYSSSPPTARLIRQWIADLKQLRKTALVWAFPRVARDVYWRDKKNGKNYYHPGIALLIRPPRAR